MSGGLKLGSVGHWVAEAMETGLLEMMGISSLPPTPLRSHDM